MKRHYYLQAIVAGFLCCFLTCAQPVWGTQDSLTEAVANPLAYSGTIEKDGKEYHPAVQLYITHQGQILVSLLDTVQLFSCYLEYCDNGSLYVRRLETSIEFTPWQYFATRDLLLLTPLQRLDNVFVPLQTLAQNLGYTYDYQEKSSTVCLGSPEYQELLKSGQEPAFLELQELPAPPADLPVWGCLGPELSAYWPQEKIIGSYYTTLINSPEGRTSNIILSCASINGTILPSGEVFSFNKKVGERTTAAGYKQAKIFVGKSIVSGLGGGICQTATTLYNAGLESELEIVERHPHTLPVAYIGRGRDATVSWSGADLKFRNTLNRPVKILCAVYGPYVLAAVAEVK